MKKFLLFHIIEIIFMFIFLILNFFCIFLIMKDAEVLVKLNIWIGLRLYKIALKWLLLILLFLNIINAFQMLNLIKLNNILPIIKSNKKLIVFFKHNLNLMNLKISFVPSTNLQILFSFQIFPTEIPDYRLCFWIINCESMRKAIVYFLFWLLIYYCVLLGFVTFEIFLLFIHYLL